MTDSNSSDINFGDVPESKPRQNAKSLLARLSVEIFDDLPARIDSVFECVNHIGELWKTGYLDKADPQATDLNSYLGPILTVGELFLEHKVMLSLAQDLYENCIELTERHCRENKVDLHLGALYANLGITFLLQGKYKSALPWLHAAAQQDQKHYSNVTSIYDSYAFSRTGIFGKWLDGNVLIHLPADVLAFVNNTLATNYTNDDFKLFIGWLAGRGDLHIVSSLLDYAEVVGKDDFHADSVRLSSIRDLATLSEILIKQIGTSHNDPAVVSSFADAPTYAGLICHMHFTERTKDRRQNPLLNVNRQAGLFHNSLLQSDAILDSIDTRIDYCSGKTNSLSDVWNYLQSNNFSTDPLVDGITKRLLLAYKLRNTTSHSFQPVDPFMKSHYDDFRLWLLQAVSILYFWTKKNGYAAL
ncbi:MAG: hypothetical protein GC190_20020 [Alphaproteobacteria bacterium]|nr:hypothetical protein [Alphaproteobacteria bacterium]